MERCVQPEQLDELPPRDPRATRSRRDLRRLNALMQHPAVMARTLDLVLNGQPSLRLVELGAGDGAFLCQVARRLNGRWRGVEAVLIDRLEVFDRQNQSRLGSLGWRVGSRTFDALDWLRTNPAGNVDVIAANLLLHQFEDRQIRELFRLAARSTRVFIALEPRRGRWPLLCSRLLWLAGCGPVTRHDAPVSVRAGFRARELSALWPDAERWELSESAVGWFSHRFVARKRGENP